MTSLIDVTDDTFGQEVLASPTPVLVDFWAPLCGPCRDLVPVLADVSRRWEGRLKIVKVNVGEHQAVASTLRVAMTPTMVLFAGGKAVAQINGIIRRHSIDELLRDNIGLEMASA